MKISDFGLARYDGYQTKRHIQSAIHGKPTDEVRNLHRLAPSVF